jgi:small conductance mechanosensitive channel
METTANLEKWLDLSQLINLYLVPFGLKVVIAIVLWFVGGLIIKGILRVLKRAMTLRNLDTTLATYATSTAYAILRGIQIMIILEVCGVQTTSFAALIGAIGVALGVAWSGLLANFAAGIFLVILRPFKVGDYINVAGQTGTVAEVGMFVTKLTADNNILVHIGNNKLFSDTIINFSTNPTRRGEVRYQIAHNVNVDDAMAKLLTIVKQVPGVLDTPAPNISVAELNVNGIALNVRFYATTKTFSTVSTDVATAVARLYTSPIWPAPATYQVAVTQPES